MKRIIIACTLLLVSACNDPIAPNREAVNDSLPGYSSAPSEHYDTKTMELFDVKLKVSGSFKPNTPVHVQVIARANLNVGSGTVSVYMPESSANSNQKVPVELPKAGQMQPAARWEAALARGSENTYSTTVFFNQPGYYQVHVTASGTPAEQTDEFLQPVTHRHAWIWIDSTGGLSTPKFDYSLFPEGAVRTPGPLRFLSDILHGPASSSSGQMANISQNSCWIGTHFYCEAFLSALYYDQDSGSYEPLANAKVTTRYYDRDPSSGAQIYVGGETQYTDSDGKYRIDCSMYVYYTDDVIVVGDIKMTNGDLTVEKGSSGQATSTAFNHSKVYDVCDFYTHGYEYVYDVNNPRNQARVFDNMMRSIDNSRSLLGYSRGHIKTKVYDSGSTTANYSSWPDDIEIYPTSVWGNYGKFTAGHEYGHALHEKGLGGNVASGLCGSSHSLRSPSNLGCAFSEGFADFHAALTLGMHMVSSSSGYLDYSLKAAETNWKDPSGGAATESKVGAFFHDLADLTSTPDQVSGDDDPAGYGGQYVAKGIKNCVIGWREDISQINEDGMVQELSQRARDLPDLIHCYKGGVTTTGRTSLSSLDSQGNIITLLAVSATAVTDASGWSQSSVQSIWNANIAN